MTDRPNAVIAGSLAEIKFAFFSRTMPIPMCGCMVWMEGLQRGYGCLKWGGRVWRAHRLAWVLESGPIPDGLNVLHKCDVPSCVNPAHLFLGTNLDNARDREQKRRGNQPSGNRHWAHLYPEMRPRGDRNGARTHPETRQGVRNGRAKLTPEQVIAIRGDVRGPCAVSVDYGVTKTTITGIRNGRLWRHL